MRSRGARIGLFVAVLAVAVLAAASAGFILADQPDRPTDATFEQDYYTSPDFADATLADRSGEIAIESDEPRTILIATDRDPADLEFVVAALTEHGHDVRFYGAGGAPPMPAMPGEVVQEDVAIDQPPAQQPQSQLGMALADADAMVVLGAQQFSPADEAAIEAFADAGGPVAIATNPTAGTFGGANADAIADRFNVTVGEGYLYDTDDHDRNYERIFADATGVGPTSGEYELVLQRAAPVWHDGGEALVTAEATHATTRDGGTFDVAVERDGVLVVGDENIFDATNFDRADNEQFLGDVFTFLTTGPESPFEPDASDLPADPEEDEFPEEPIDEDDRAPDDEERIEEPVDEDRGEERDDEPVDEDRGEDDVVEE